MVARSQKGLERGQTGRFQLDKKGCLFVSVSIDAGVTREATEARHGNLWRVTYESLSGPGLTVEHSDNDADGIWDSETRTRRTDAGWLDTTMIELETDGGPIRRYRRIPTDKLRMRVVQDAWRDGGWELEEDFETSIRQR